MHIIWIFCGAKLFLLKCYESAMEWLCPKCIRLVQVLKQIDKSRQIGLFQKVITTFENIFLYKISMKYEYLKRLKKLARVVHLGPHFLCWISEVVRFNTWLILIWEENKCCYKLSKFTKFDIYFTQKGSSFNFEWKQ